MTEEEKIAVSYLPDRLRSAAAGCMSRFAEGAGEIRLRTGGKMTITICTRPLTNADCMAVCTSDEMRFTLDRLCAGSLYAHSETIREGVIVTSDGLRAGISGRAVVSDGRVECVRDITSVSIRIPHRIPGAADSYFGLFSRYGSICVASPPGMGKTTILREMIPLISERLRAAVIDTRFELGAGLSECGLADFYPGWPRSEGISAAVRSMSPDCIICDEISDADDCLAVRSAASSGVRLVVSVHGGSMQELLSNPRIGAVFSDRIFGCVCKIGRKGAEVMFP